MELRQIVYASTATVAFSDAALDALLVNARSNNDRNDITGVLLYLDGGFFQLLEGPEPALSETFSRIAADPRHTGLVKLSDRKIARRAFSPFPMAFRALREKDLNAHPGLFVRSEKGWTLNPESGLDRRIKVLFDTFFLINATARY